MNRDKHIYEGWTVGDFIDELEPIFDMIQNPNQPTLNEKFTNREKLMDWCMDMQPYYKKHIPEVFNYFVKKANL